MHYVSIYSFHYHFVSTVISSIKSKKVRCRILFGSVLTVIILFPFLCHAKEILVGNFEVDGLAGWSPKVFQGKTSYSLVDENGRMVVQAVSKSAASGLVKKINFNPLHYRYLKWSWKIDHILKKGDGRLKAGDDYAARIYVIFPGLFPWQMKAINYVWANRLPKGGSFSNAFTGNAMMVAVESGSAQAGHWMNEERDVLADYRRLFGSNPPEAGAIAIMTDTDNTGSDALAWYGDISLSTRP